MLYNEDSAELQYKQCFPEEEEEESSVHYMRNRIMILFLTACEFKKVSRLECESAVESRTKSQVFCVH